MVIAFAQISLYITVELKRFKTSFFPSSTYNWNKLDPDIQKSSSLEIYKRALLKFIRPTSANVYKINHPRGLKLLTRLRLGLSHLREHNFRYNFNDTIDPFCSCRTNCLETTEHFLLHCPIYASFRLNLFDNLRNNNILVLPLNKSSIVQIFYMDPKIMTIRTIILSFPVQLILLFNRNVLMIRYLINPSINQNENFAL